MTQSEALKILESGKDVFLTGPAGSGKTFLLQKFIAGLKAKGKSVGICASTGIAATHIGGRTIHSWAGIEIKERLSMKEMRKLTRTQRMREQFQKTKVLVIDEISMLDSTRLDLVDQVCRAFKDPFQCFGGLQVVYCGDFFQLPPISRQADQPIPFAWKADVWQRSAPVTCYLTEQHRQDDDGFLSALNAIRNQELEDKHRDLIESRIIGRAKSKEKICQLYSHNFDVDSVNLRELGLLPDEEKVFNMRTRGPRDLVASLKKSCLAPEQLRLKAGAKVMFVKNKYNENGTTEYVNGTMGTVIAFDREYGFPIVETLDGRVVVAGIESWAIEEDEKTLAAVMQIPLRLAWAITVHKSQGMSLDEALIDLSRCFEYGMGYVALSRLRSLSGLHLLGINEKAYEVHPEVAVFERQLNNKLLDC